MRAYRPPAGKKSRMTYFAANDLVIFIPAGVTMQDNPLLDPINPAVFYRDVIIAGHIGGSGERTLLTEVDAYPRLGFVGAIYLYVSDGDAFAGIGMKGIIRDETDDADARSGRTRRKLQEPVRPTVNGKVIHSREPEDKSARDTRSRIRGDSDLGSNRAVDGERDIILPHPGIGAKVRDIDSGSTTGLPRIVR